MMMTMTINMSVKSSITHVYHLFFINGIFKTNSGRDDEHNGFQFFRSVKGRPEKRDRATEAAECHAYADYQ